MRGEFGRRWLVGGLIALTLSAVYLYGFPSATIFYAFVDLLHVAGGIILTGLLAYCGIYYLRGLLPRAAGLARAGWILLFAGAALGLALIKIGTSLPLRPWLYAHIALCCVGVLCLAASWVGNSSWLNASSLSGGSPGRAGIRRALSFAALALLMTAVAAGAWWSREVAWKKSNRITNPQMPPETMDAEGDGPQGKFFPSSAQTKHGGNIPSEYFMKSDACERCHADIYKQWNSSVHHFSSFNNQWYRKSIEYMQEVDGVQPSKWCAGCHDPALLFSGKFDTPIKEIVDTPEAQAGLGCVMCHRHRAGEQHHGAGRLHCSNIRRCMSLRPARIRLVRTLHDFLVHVNPEPHRRTFHEAVHARGYGRVLLVVPQGASGCAREPLPVDPRIQRIRQLAGQRCFRAWGTIVLLSAKSADELRGLPHAAWWLPRTPGTLRGKVHSHRFPGRTPRCRWRIRMLRKRSLPRSFCRTSK